MRRHKKWKLILILSLLALVGMGQSLDYAKNMVQVLSSPALKGRGYVGNGDSLAAFYIAKQWDSLGLKPMGINGIQTFSLDINTFPNPIALKINGKEMELGAMYIPSPGSPSFKGKTTYIKLDSNDLKNERIKTPVNKKVALVLTQDAQFYIKKHPKSLEKYNFNLVIEEKQKLTASLSQTVDEIPELWIKEGNFTKKKGTLSLNLENQFIKKYKSQNLIYKIPGNSDSIILLCAHYDHLGQLGNSVYFPGANDNASGISMLSVLANHFSQNKPKYTLVFMAFGAEEAGLVGSKYFVEHPWFYLNSIKFLINLDLVGTGDEGIQIVNSTVFTEQFLKLKNINQQNQYFDVIKTRGKAANSDHYYFSEKGVPSFFIYTLGGIKAYHDVDDTYEKLPFTKFNELYHLLVDFVLAL